ncbi:MAG: PSD1 domain-containing protein [Planctomyces sp.]|nr:PSD1 domain-containing protein [Planctomyces sp.]
MSFQEHDRQSQWLLYLACLILPVAGAISVHADETPTAADLEFFETKIRPVLVEHCYECHAADSKILRGNLLLDSRAGIAKGGDSGTILGDGNPAESLLIQALRHESLIMPPKEKLSDQIISDFTEWVRRGAPDPRVEAKQARLKPVDWTAARQHWAFQPVTDPSPPQVMIDERLRGMGVSENWVQSPIDQFILDRLLREELTPAPRADRRTLIRRATFDLTGLPPTVEEINQFLADDSPDAFSKVVNRLLESPQYGERWGRHWLDLVRYATTNGADENHGLPNAWKYRDWVVRKINADLPLNEFLTQQLAGDLLPVPDDEKAAGDLLAATGMLVIGPKMLAEQDKDKMMIDIVDEQIDTVSRTMLGLTVGCARCHDHKFDPVSARDYYALAGIFYSTQSMADRAFVSKWMERPLPSQELVARRAEHQQKIDTAKAELEQLPKDDEAGRKARQAAIEQLEKEMPAPDLVMAVQEGEIHDLPVHIRGNHLKPGPEKIPRGMPSILTEVAAPAAIDKDRSGRLELAQWLVDSQNPLTRRVLMNRVWMWHFGRPLMTSPSNWGLQSTPPSHPELLDWLAQELVRRNWSLKEMHRVILLSSAWQMSSQCSEAVTERDPENRLLARQNRRRLEAEPVRDSLLFVGGSLDQTMGGMAPGVDAKRRAIYLPVDRAALYEMFSTFDYVETANHIEQRPVTTVPNQALFLMNSQIVHEQARKLIETLPTSDPGVPYSESSSVIVSLFETLYGRPPGPEEIRTSVAFLEQAEATLAATGDIRERRLQAWSALCRTLMSGNEFVYLD